MSLSFFGPPISSVPSSWLAEISVILIPLESESSSASNWPIVTLLLNWISPVLLNAVIKSPILKSPSSFVPEVNTLPPFSLNCSNATFPWPPFSGNAL